MVQIASLPGIDLDHNDSRNTCTSQQTSSSSLYTIVDFLILCVAQVPTDLCSTYNGMSDKFLNQGLNLSFISLIRWQGGMLRP